MFKSQKEIWQHLISGGKVGVINDKESYFFLNEEGRVCHRNGYFAHRNFSNHECFCIYEEPKPKKKVNLYRHTFQWKDGDIWQSVWTDQRADSYAKRYTEYPKLLMTEAKEIEVDL